MNAKPSLEILPASLISQLTRHVKTPALETWVSTPRAFTNTEPSKASSRPGAVVTRSHRHHRESEE